MSQSCQAVVFLFGKPSSKRYFEVALTLGNKGSSGNTENKRQMELKAIFWRTKNSGVHWRGKQEPAAKLLRVRAVAVETKFIVTATIEQAVQEWCATYGIQNKKWASPPKNVFSANTCSLKQLRLCSIVQSNTARCRYLISKNVLEYIFNPKRHY